MGGRLTLTNVEKIVKNLKQSEDEIIVNENSGQATYVRTVLIRKFPSTVSAGFFDTIDSLFEKGNIQVRTSLEFAPTKLKWNRSMKWKLKRLRNNLKNETETEMIRNEEVEALEALRGLKDAQFKKNAKLFDIWAYVKLSSTDESELNAATRTLVELLEDLDAKVELFEKEQIQAFQQSLLINSKNKKSKEFLEKYYGLLAHDSAASILYPFIHGNIGDDQGVYIGNRAEDNQFTFLDICNPDDQDAKNMIVLGTTGSGKSFFMKVLAVGLMIAGVKVFVFDVDGEWKEICENVGGVYVDQSFQSGKYADPFRLLPWLEEVDKDCIQHNKERLQKSIETVHRTLELLTGGNVPDDEYNAIDRTIIQLHEDAGIDRNDTVTWDNFTGPKPTIHRFYEQLKIRADHDEAANRFKEKIWRYFEGNQKKMFEQEDEQLLYENAPMIVYHLGQSINQKDDRVAAVKMNLAFDQVWANIQHIKLLGEQYSAVICDEGQRLLFNETASDYVYTLATTIRKWNGQIILGTNTPEVLLKGGTKGGQGLWENTPIKVFFWMEESALTNITTHTNIPSEIVEFIDTQFKTNVFVLRYNQKYDFLKVHVPPEEEVLYHTRGLKKKAQTEFMEKAEEQRLQRAL